MKRNIETALVKRNQQKLARNWMNSRISKASKIRLVWLRILPDCHIRLQSLNPECSGLETTAIVLNVRLATNTQDFMNGSRTVLLEVLHHYYLLCQIHCRILHYYGHIKRRDSSNLEEVRQEGMGSTERTVLTASNIFK